VIIESSEDLLGAKPSAGLQQAFSKPSADVQQAFSRSSAGRLSRGQSPFWGLYTGFQDSRDSKDFRPDFTDFKDFKYIPTVLGLLSRNSRWVSGISTI